MDELFLFLQGILIIVQGIISIIILIVFFFMAANVSKIKKYMLRTSDIGIEREIKLLLFKGKKEEVLDRYYELAFNRLHLKEDGHFKEDKAKALSRIGVKIEELGGSVPSEMQNFIDKHTVKSKIFRR